jgi:FkbM family methyltransferase
MSSTRGLEGARFLVKPGESTLTGNIYTGLYEFRAMAFLLHLLRPGDLFIDVGANLGSYTLLACAARGARGMAFEPVPSSFARLVENLRLNAIEDRVRCLSQAVGAEPGTLAFRADRHAQNRPLAPGEQCANPIQVPLTTLDQALAGEEPFLLKIDVEGYETAVIQGAQQTLQRPSLHAVIMELKGRGSRYGFDEARALGKMLDLGFQTFTYQPFRRALIDLNGKTSPSANTLFIRDISRVEERLRTAPPIRLHGKEF